MDLMNPGSTHAVRELLGTKVFGATFVKADNTERRGAFRLGVKKGVTGKGLAYNPDDRGNLIVWDMKLGEYRTIKLARLKEIRAFGTKVVL